MLLEGLLPLPPQCLAQSKPSINTEINERMGQVGEEERKGTNLDKEKSRGPLYQGTELRRKCRAL